MGGNCSTKIYPPTQSSNYNLCDGAVGDVSRIPHFCTLSGSHNDVRQRFCSYWGDSTEWTFDSQGGIGDCAYNDCDEYLDFGGGCCNGCCGISGSGANCRRTAFLGDPITCCLSDYVCTSGRSDGITCFADDRKQRTCDPNYRDMGGIGYQDTLYNFCVGNFSDGTPDPNLTSEQFFNRWIGVVKTDGSDPGLGNSSYGGRAPSRTFNTPCYNALWRNLYSTPGSPSAGACAMQPGMGIPTSSGYIWSRRLFAGMLRKYLSPPINGQLAQGPGGNGANNLNEMIWNICSIYPA